jgi:hypothetical protein
MRKNYLRSKKRLKERLSREVGLMQSDKNSLETKRNLFLI